VKSHARSTALGETSRRYWASLTAARDMLSVLVFITATHREEFNADLMAFIKG
jgi:hypothetical protein